MNKKRRGIALLEVIVSTALIGMCILTLNKLVGLDLQTRQNIDAAISQSEYGYITQILFDDIKGASQMVCTSSKKLAIYSDNAIVNYTIDDGYFYRNAEKIGSCKSGFFDVASNTALIVVSGDTLDLKLRINGGD